MTTLYGQSLYQQSLYSGPGVEGTWRNSYSFDYERGVTVLVTIHGSVTVPQGTTLKLYAGEDVDRLVPVPMNVETPILFTDTVTGIATLVIFVEMKSNLVGSSPIIDTLTVDIRQEASLYTTAVQVLEDAREQSPFDYFIDPWLQNVLIPYAWFNPVRHRFALSRIAEAAGGYVYQDRNGVVLIESALFENGNAFAADVNDNRILDAKAPVSEVSNIITIETRPYVEAPGTELWTLTGDNIINNGQQRAFEIFFNDFDAVLNDSVTIDMTGTTPAGATVVSQTWYTWGGRFTVEGSADGQQLAIAVNGTPLVVSGSRIIEAQDTDSIRRNGQSVKTIDDNQLIQNPVIAQLIANSTLQDNKNELRNVDPKWRGDPTIVPGDRIRVNGAPMVIYEQDIDFNGALVVQSRCRRIS